MLNTSSTDLNTRLVRGFTPAAGAAFTSAATTGKTVAFEIVEAEIAAADIVEVESVAAEIAEVESAAAENVEVESVVAENVNTAKHALEKRSENQVLARRDMDEAK